MKKVLVSRSLLALSALGLAIMPGVAQSQNRNQNGRAYGQTRNGNFATLEGVVTRVDNSNRNGVNRFQVQADGKKFDVQSDDSFPVRQGQRVTLRGSFEGANNFNARSVTLGGRVNPNGNRPSNGSYRNNSSDNNDRSGRNSGTYGRGGGRYDGGRYDGGRYNGREDDDYQSGSDQLVNFPGVVTRVVSARELEVRADNGRTYRVALRRDAGEYQVGNRIRVIGSAAGNRVENARLTFQNGGVVGPRNGGNYGNGNYGNGNYGNGNPRTGSYGNGGVFGNNSGESRVFGDRDSVFGDLEDGRKVDLSGRIVSINTRERTRTAIVRASNGREYTIRSKDLENYRTGQNVRVRGKVSDGVVEASDIDSAR